RTASSMNSCVYRALGLPIFPSSLREFYTLSKGSIFCGQAQKGSGGACHSSLLYYLLMPHYLDRLLQYAGSY
ncbi:MAG: hypothetical protein RXS25_28605, partial [Paraburkholderia sp.]|uniref:hypothetical protein n=1 Tax=Paraburkholderia sp. TaxID=1926495 RepID=UPI00397DB404